MNPEHLSAQRVRILYRLYRTFGGEELAAINRIFDNAPLPAAEVASFKVKKAALNAVTSMAKTLAEDEFCAQFEEGHNG
ncbi:MAG: hypothetical protein AB7V08_09965 [Elusimicrobiales bacterium]